VGGKATGYGLDDRGVGVRVPVRGKNFLFSKSSRLFLVSTHPPIEWVTGVLSPEVKGPGREADHSPVTSANIKETWICTSTHPFAYMVYCSLLSTWTIFFFFLHCKRKPEISTRTEPSYSIQVAFPWMLSICSKQRRHAAVAFAFKRAAARCHIVIQSTLSWASCNTRSRLQVTIRLVLLRTLLNYVVLVTKP
jgi:hypothetical protein